MSAPPLSQWRVLKVGSMVKEIHAPGIRRLFYPPSGRTGGNELVYSVYCLGTDRNYEPYVITNVDFGFDETR